MKIPFFKRFKKGERAPRQAAPAAYQTSKPSTISKPEGERLSKTVMPNVTRTVSTEESAEVASSALNEGTLEAPSPTPRAVSFGPTKKAAVGRNKDLPPAVAFALEPRVERAISLDLADVLNQMPAGLTKPLESLDKSRRILVKASELEKKMAMGKPTLSLASLHHQAPEIFLRPVAAEDKTEIALPFDKVLEAFMQMQVRRDQVSDDVVPQVETPFLQVTLEDSEKFGVPNEPVPAPAKSPARAEAAPAGAEAAPNSERFMPIPATAAAIAAAHPEEAAATEVIRVPRPQATEPEKPLRIPLATQPEGKSNRASKPAPDRIPFHLPPKETGAPASERVPASSGPPVSTPSSAARVPFEMAPEMDLPQVGGDDKKISLALKPILQSLPVFELSGDPKEVPEEARIEFSFSLIHSQLSSGRIAIAPELFERALPAGSRRFFTAKNLQVPVVLPLQEVLRNLPPEALQMRGDQEQGEVAAETIETPFSTTAAEDAKRFGERYGPEHAAADGVAAGTGEADSTGDSAGASATDEGSRAACDGTRGDCSTRARCEDCGDASVRVARSERLFDLLYRWFEPGRQPSPRAGRGSSLHDGADVIGAHRAAPDRFQNRRPPVRDAALRE